MKYRKTEQGIKGTSQGTIFQSLVQIDQVVSEEKGFQNSSPIFLFLVIPAILIGILENRTNFVKGTIKGLFQKSLVHIGPVVSEKNGSLLLSQKLLSQGKVGFFVA